MHLSYSSGIINCNGETSTKHTKQSHQYRCFSRSTANDDYNWFVMVVNKKLKTYVGPMIRLIQSCLNNCLPLIWSRNVRWDGVEVPSWSGDSTDQENVALLNPKSPHSIVVGLGISPCDGLSVKKSNNSVFCKKSVIRSNETLAERERHEGKSNKIEKVIPWIRTLIWYDNRRNCILSKENTDILEKILEARYVLVLAIIFYCKCYYTHR